MARFRTIRWNLGASASPMGWAPYIFRTILSENQYDTKFMTSGEHEGHHHAAPAAEEAAHGDEQAGQEGQEQRSSSPCCSSSAALAPRTWVAPSARQVSPGKLADTPRTVNERGSACRCGQGRSPPFRLTPPGAARILRPP